MLSYTMLFIICCVLVLPLWYALELKIRIKELQLSRDYWRQIALHYNKQMRLR
jgi:hypothetical protein